MVHYLPLKEGMSLPGKAYRKHSIRGWAHTHTPFVFANQLGITQGLIYCPNSRNNFNCFGIITGRTCQHVKSLHTWTLPSTSSWFSRKRTLLVKTTKDSSYNYLDIPFSTVYHQNGREGRFLAAGSFFHMNQALDLLQTRPPHGPKLKGLKIPTTQFSGANC